MTRRKLTETQEAKLAEILKVAKLFEQQAQELSELGDAFAIKWEARLNEARQKRDNHL